MMMNRNCQLCVAAASASIHVAQIELKTLLLLLVNERQL